MTDPTGNVNRSKSQEVSTYGIPNYFQLISKVVADDGSWMKSTKAAEIPGVGCLVQVSTREGDIPAEALAFVPGVMIEGNKETGRRLVAMQTREPPIIQPSTEPVTGLDGDEDLMAF